MKLCGFDVGLDQPFFLIAGPCVVESEQLQMDVAGHLKEVTAGLGIHFIFKSSYDKANRSSGTTFRGPGMDKGLEILAKVRRELKVPVLTDVHGIDEIAAVAAAVDVLQTPAFLCRQTDFITAVAQSGKPVNVKKGQFLAPGDMKNVIAKARAAARAKGLNEDNFMACERHPFGAVARRPGHQQRRPARVRAGAGARRHCRGRRRRLHGDPSRPGERHERRAERRAAAAHEGAARNPAGARPRDQKERLPRKRLPALNTEPRLFTELRQHARRDKNLSGRSS
jgi:hypothetical protein